MVGWLLMPGVGLIVAGFVIQFGSYVQRPRAMNLALLGVRLRFIGIGTLILGLAIDLIISGLVGGLSVASLAIGIFLLAMAGTWFYAATDRIFSADKEQDGIGPH
jgi:hypothetical protein